MASKRPLEGATTPYAKQTRIDLNYPISSSSNSSTITPPFIQPPLSGSNGELTVSVAQPLSINSGSIVLTTDKTLETIQGKLSVNVDPEGPISTGENGLNLMIGNGITEDEFHYLTINVSPNQPLDVSSNGLSVLYDTQALTTTNNTVNSQYELTVNLDPDGGLEKTNEGVSIKTDSTLSVDSDGLGVVCNPNGPLTADADGIDIDIDEESLEIVNGTSNQPKLSVKTYNNGGIEKNASTGISIQCDRNNFDIYSNTLRLQNYVFTSGQGIGANGFTSNVMAKIGNQYYTFRSAYEAKLISFNGIVNGSITIKIRTSDISGVPIDQQTVNPTFTFWLCRDLTDSTLQNYSNCSNNQYIPDKTSVLSKTEPDGINAWVTPSNSNWYLGGTSGENIYGTPNGDNQLSQSYVSNVAFSIVKLYNTSRARLTFTVYLTPSGLNSNKLYDSSINGAVTIGPIRFWYLVG